MLLKVIEHFIQGPIYYAIIEEIHRKIQAAIGEYDDLITMVKK